MDPVMAIAASGDSWSNDLDQLRNTGYISGDLGTVIAEEVLVDFNQHVAGDSGNGARWPREDSSTDTWSIGGDRGTR